MNQQPTAKQLAISEFQNTFTPLTGKVLASIKKISDLLYDSNEQDFMNAFSQSIQLFKQKIDEVAPLRMGGRRKKLRRTFKKFK
jgi:hypothetical protein